MTKERYDSIRSWFLRRPGVLRFIRVLNLWLPRTMYAAYPLLLGMLLLQKDERFWRVLLIPAFVFGTVTVVREFFNLQRPYEKLDIEPLIPREKKGRSFPSRHAASGVVIAAAYWYIWPTAGIAFGVIALVIAAIRILGGIHFPRDIAAGMLLSLAAGALGFWVI